MDVTGSIAAFTKAAFAKSRAKKLGSLKATRIYKAGFLKSREQTLVKKINRDFAQIFIFLLNYIFYIFYIFYNLKTTLFNILNYNNIYN